MAIPLQREEATPPQAQRKKVDWVPIAAAASGAGMLGLGLWFYLRKAGVPRGGKFIATVKFDYLGDAADYVLQVRLGTMVLGEPLPWFQPVEGLVWTLDINLPGPDSYEFEVECQVPEATTPKTYDGEAQIKLPEMAEGEYLIRELSDNVLKVVE